MATVYLLTKFYVDKMLKLYKLTMTELIFQTEKEGRNA